MQKPVYTLITGASLGLGKALALECAKRGMNLILVSLPHSGLPKLSAEIRNNNKVEVKTIEIDLCSHESCNEVLQYVKSGGLVVNALINNLGGGSTEPFALGNLKQYENQIELNVLSTVRLSYLFVGILRQQTPAYILNVGSLAAYFTVPQKGVYSASKSFILSFSKTLREELRGEGISVSVVCPSGMPTNPLSVQMISSGSLVTRVSCMIPDDVARIAVDGMLAGKRVIIPGIINRLFLWVDKILPLFLKRRLLNSAMKRLKENKECVVVSPLYPSPNSIPGTVIKTTRLKST